MKHTQSERPPLPGHGTMPDYTRAFFVSAGVLGFIGLFAVWAALGLGAVLALVFGIDWLLRRYVEPTA